jgi:hypothetical protein
VHAADDADHEAFGRRLWVGHDASPERKKPGTVAGLVREDEKLRAAEATAQA